MRLSSVKRMFLVAAAVAALGVASARAADCGDSAAGFAEWLASFKQVALKNGISQQVVDSALGGVAFDPSVSAHDHAQGFRDRISPPSPRAISRRAA